MKPVFALSALAALASCGPFSDDGPVAVAVIGTPASLFEQGVRLSPAAQHLRAATIEGLVALNPAGQAVPALAERWIVTDDGLSYIFRLRQSRWPDGEEITAEDVRTIMRNTIAALDGTSLGVDLEKISEIRAMTGRVVEIRLSSPMPDFLQLLAQPELGLYRQGNGAGPMSLAREEGSSLALLRALPPESRGLPPREDWQESAQALAVQALPAERAIKAFSEGEVDLVLGGRLANFPQVQLGPLSRGTIQLDPAWGLFGFLITNDEGLLADPARREALSMAIDRSDLMQGFAIGGWQPSAWIAPSQFFSQITIADDPWGGLSFEERIDVARSRIARWQSDPARDATVEGPARVSVAMPEGPGSDILFGQLTEDWRAIGVSAYRVKVGEKADLELVDRLARYSSPRWFLNQFNCTLKRGLCSADADRIIADSLKVIDPAVKEQMLANAQGALMDKGVFIPLGAPVRWSLVRGAITGYSPNQWGIHPLFPLSQPPT